MIFVYMRFVPETIGAIGQMGEIPLMVLAVFLNVILEPTWRSGGRR